MLSSARALAWHRRPILVTLPHDDVSPERPPVPWVGARATPLPVHHAPGYALRAAEQYRVSLWRRVNGDMATTSMYALLVALSSRPASSQREAAAAVGIDRASTTTLVGQLVTRGLIVQDVDESDLRRHRLWLTQAATAVLQDVRAAAVEVDQQLLAPLTPSEIHRIHVLWARAAGMDETVAENAGPEFLTSPGFILRRARQRHSRVWEREVGTFTPGQYASLVVLHHNPGIDVQTTARLASLEGSTGARLLTGLVKRGLISRSTDAKDRRRLILSLSGDGFAAMFRATPSVGRVQGIIMSDFDPDQIREFNRLSSLVARLR